MESKIKKYEYDRAFHKKKYRRYGIFIDKEREEEFAKAVDESGLSINKFVNVAIWEKVEKDKKR